MSTPVTINDNVTWLEVKDRVLAVAASLLLVYLVPPPSSR